MDVVEKTDREQRWMEEELEDWAMAEEVKRSFNQDAKAETGTSHALSRKHTKKKITHPEIPETGRGIKPVQAQRSGARVDASGEVMRNNIHHSILSTTRRAC